MKIWFDFTNPPHVNFFKPIINQYKNNGFGTVCTARDFVETIHLLKLYNIPFDLYGKHGGRKKINKIIALLSRYASLYRHAKAFDVSFSSNNEAPFVSWLRKKPAFVFDDNDISPNWLYSKFASYVISPAFIDKNAMHKMGISKNKLICYKGFKENIYIADYLPDPHFLEILPFKEFITVRPENIQAAYVPKGVKSIVPVLIDSLIKKGFNILYLPRYKSDIGMIKLHKNIFIPEKPLNGLDVSYYSSAVLTGAGSFSREAAILGTPAISFYAGKKFLGVDKEMIHKNMVFASRNPTDIVNYVTRSNKNEFNIEQSKNVQTHLFDRLDSLLKELD